MFAERGRFEYTRRRFETHEKKERAEMLYGEMAIDPPVSAYGDATMIDRQVKSLVTGYGPVFATAVDGETIVCGNDNAEFVQWKRVNGVWKDTLLPMPVLEGREHFKICEIVPIADDEFVIRHATTSDPSSGSGTAIPTYILLSHLKKEGDTWNRLPVVEISGGNQFNFFIRVSSGEYFCFDNTRDSGVLYKATQSAAIRRGDSRGDLEQARVEDSWARWYLLQKDEDCFVKKQIKMSQEHKDFVMSRQPLCATSLDEGMFVVGCSEGEICLWERGVDGAWEVTELPNASLVTSSFDIVRLSETSFIVLHTEYMPLEYSGAAVVHYKKEGSEWTKCVVNAITDGTTDEEAAVQVFPQADADFDGHKWIPRSEMPDQIVTGKEFEKTTKILPQSDGSFIAVNHDGLVLWRYDDHVSKWVSEDMRLSFMSDIDDITKEDFYIDSIGYTKDGEIVGQLRSTREGYRRTKIRDVMFVAEPKTGEDALRVHEEGGQRAVFGRESREGLGMLYERDFDGKVRLTAEGLKEIAAFWSKGIDGSQNFESFGLDWTIRVTGLHAFLSKLVWGIRTGREEEGIDRRDVSEVLREYDFVSNEVAGD